MLIYFYLQHGIVYALRYLVTLKNKLKKSIDGMRSLCDSLSRDAC